MNSLGRFAVAWAESPTGVSWNVQMRQLSVPGGATGTPVYEDAGTVINTTAAVDQRDPDIDMDSVGNIVVVWRTKNAAASLIEGRYFRGGAVTASPSGNDFTVDTTGTLAGAPAVAMSPSGGGFVVCWAGNDTSSGSDDWDIYCAGYAAPSATGDPPVLTSGGNDTAKNQRLVGQQENPDVAILPGGSVVVVWQTSDGDPAISSDIAARRWSSSTLGTASAELTVNDLAAVNLRPRVAAGGTGGTSVVVVWETTLPGSPPQILAKEFDGSLSTPSPDIPVATDSTRDLKRPAVTLNGQNHFVVGYEDGDDVYGVLFQQP
jgi:hypothetical protein